MAIVLNNEYGDMLLERVGNLAEIIHCYEWEIREIIAEQEEAILANYRGHDYGED